MSHVDFLNNFNTHFLIPDPMSLKSYVFCAYTQNFHLEIYMFCTKCNCQLQAFLFSHKVLLVNPIVYAAIFIEV